jgi:hypothetical protein
MAQISVTHEFKPVIAETSRPGHQRSVGDLGAARGVLVGVVLGCGLWLLGALIYLVIRVVVHP